MRLMGSVEDDEKAVGSGDGKRTRRRVVRDVLKIR